jgi:hypothetical protein
MVLRSLEHSLVLAASWWLAPHTGAFYVVGAGWVLHVVSLLCHTLLYACTPNEEPMQVGQDTDILPSVVDPPFHLAHIELIETPMETPHSTIAV